MSEWTEQALRGAASWRAFKEGLALRDGGAVVEAKKTESGWRGAVRVGKRVFRVGVVVKSVTDFEVRCSCPENQASGEVCCHAVATGMQALAGAGAVKKPDEPKAAVAQKSSWDLVLPGNWRDALRRGKLSVLLRESKADEISAADEKLGLWLESQRVARSPDMHLHLDGKRVDDFLLAIIDHPRVRSGQSSDALQISKGARIAVSEVYNAGDFVRLIPAASEWFELDGSYWRVGESGLDRLGDGAMPDVGERVMRGLARQSTVELPMREFLDRIGLFQNWLELPESGWLGSLHFVPARFEAVLSLDGALSRVEARVSLRYEGGDAVFPMSGGVVALPRLVGDRCEVRDLAGEAKVLEAMCAAGFDFSINERGVLAGEVAVIGFLSRVLPKLRGAWKIDESANFKRASEKVLIVSPRIEIQGTGDDWLNFDLSYETGDGARVPAAEIQRMLRSGAGVEKRSDGRRIVLSDEIGNLIDPLIAELDVRQEGGHYEARGVSADVVTELCANFSKSGAVEMVGSAESFQKPSTLVAEPRPYQSAGAAWMVERVRRFGGALLADDMGLGKTLQAIAVVEHLFETKSDDCGLVLVVATASLLGNWRAEFARFAPKRRVVVMHGAGRESLREGLRDGDVVITSYGTLARDLVWHLGREYCAVVVDEASLMRNPDTDHARALFKLRSKARIALTGTPLENGVGDLWSIFRFVLPGWLGVREDFKQRYEMPLRVVGGDSGVMERLRLRLKPLMLRRSKEQVAPDLPSKLIIDEWCELTDQQKIVYRDLQVEGRKLVQVAGDSGNAAAVRMRMLTALLRLRQACCDLSLLGSERLKQMLSFERSAKMQRLFELLEEAISGNHKVLIFSQFQKQLLEIEKRIQERQWGCLRLDGQTRNRQALVDKFQSADGPPIFLISLKAGGYGLNLTAADVVIHFDPWWNPAAEAQATDRAHRIGQTRPVTVYRLLTRGTVEEKVVRMQAGKRELAAGLDEEGGGDGGLTAAEMRSVLTGD